MRDNRYFKPGDMVIAWSNERYGVYRLTVCEVEDVEGDELHLYAIEENRAFYRNRKEVMTYDELVMDFNRIKEDFETVYNEE